MTPAYESYAEALYSAAEKLGCTDTVAGELPAIVELLSKCGSYLNSPLINAGDKATLLREALSDKVAPLTLEFTMLLTTRRHLKHFSAATGHFLQICGHGKPVVRLRLPYEPEQDMISRLTDRLTEAGLIPADSAEPELCIVEDRDLIGGLIASCNGYQIDTSLKTALRKMAIPERNVHIYD